MFFPRSKSIFQQDAAPRFHVSDQIRPEQEVK